MDFSTGPLALRVDTQGRVEGLEVVRCFTRRWGRGYVTGHVRRGPRGEASEKEPLGRVLTHDGLEHTPPTPFGTGTNGPPQVPKPYVEFLTVWIFPRIPK